MVSLTRVVSISSFALAATACASVPPVLDLTAAGNEIRARSQVLAAAEARKDIETVLTFWDDEPVIHIEGAPAIVGRAGLRGAYQEFFASGFVAFTSTVGALQVARSGELAWETGINHLTYERGGQRVVDVGKYLAVWRRGTDREWRLTAISVTNDKAQQ